MRWLPARLRPAAQELPAPYLEQRREWFTTAATFAAALGLKDEVRGGMRRRAVLLGAALHWRWVLVPVCWHGAWGVVAGGRALPRRGAALLQREVRSRPRAGATGGSHLTYPPSPPSPPHCPQIVVDSLLLLDRAMAAGGEQAAGAAPVLLVLACLLISGHQGELDCGRWGGWAGLAARAARHCTYARRARVQPGGRRAARLLARSLASLCCAGGASVPVTRKETGRRAAKRRHSGEGAGSKQSLVLPLAPLPVGEHVDRLPSPARLEAVTGLPAHALAQAEQTVRQLLGNDTAGQCAWVPPGRREGGFCCAGLASL